MDQDLTPPVSDSIEALSAPEPTEADRDAIVFLAGLGVAEVGESIDDTARRIATALDDESPPAAQFVVEEGKDEDYGKSRGVKGRTRRVTVARKADPGGSSRPIVDLYSLDYRQTLIGDLLQKSPLKLLVLIFWTLLSNASKLLFSVTSRSKSSTEKWQVRMAWFWYFTLALYAVVVLGALLGTLPSTAQQQLSSPKESSAVVTELPGAEDPEAAPSGEASEETLEPRPEADDTPEKAVDLAAKLQNLLASAWPMYLSPLTKACTVLVVWLTALGLLFKTDIKAMIQKSGVETVAACRYLTLDTGKESIANKFSALLNHIAEKEDVTYREVHVVAYSFGTVAVLDALYPHHQPPAIFRMIKSLVTIGCPFDFIRTYWPDYFDGRSSDGIPRPWLNIFARADVLSSDFEDVVDKRDDPEKVEPKKVGIRLADSETQLRPESILYGRDKALDEYRPLERYGLIGFRAHSQYWEKGTAGCYRNIVQELLDTSAGMD